MSYEDQQEMVNYLGADIEIDKLKSYLDSKKDTSADVSSL
jgi:hypothetical protein